MEVTIKIIPHDQQRYPTCGDWTVDDKGDLTIKVSKLSDWRREMLVAVHELVEVLQCRHDGVTQESVDKFDIEFEAHRHPDNNDEPGDNKDAPYYKQHQLATGIERILAAELGVDWNEYADELEALP